MRTIAIAFTTLLLSVPAFGQMLKSQTVTTKDGSTFTTSVVAGANPQQYILKIHIEGQVPAFRYTFHFTLDDMPGTNRQTRGYRDGFVERNPDQTDIEIVVPTGGALKECNFSVMEAPPWPKNLKH